MNLWSLQKTSGGISDIRTVYVDIVKDLKARGL
jgi:hypothetical protein